MIAFVTIATGSHLSAAQVALSSVCRKEVNRKYLYTIGNIDASSRLGATGIVVRRVEDRLDASIFTELMARYTRSELCFALKPYVLQDLVNDGYDAHYIDSDIKFFSSIAPLVDAMRYADILLTPHYLFHLPEDGLTPNALTLLRGGVFNAGYVGVKNSSEGMRFLSWWCRRVYRHAFNAPHLGMCGDQRWLDLVPVLFPGMQIFRHVGANVAYWNLHERHLRRRESSSYTVCDSPLLFFHFSGFDPSAPFKLSIHQNRVPVRRGTALDTLLRQYADELTNAGWRKSPNATCQGREWLFIGPVIKLYRRFRAIHDFYPK